MSPHAPIPPISEQELTPLVRALLGKIEEYAGIILELRETVQQLKAEIAVLKDEIAVLKGQKPRPKIPPGKLDKDKPGSLDANDGKGAQGKAYRLCCFGRVS